ncbi:MAG: hypothetical protein MUF54_25595 [Polyangiaceae bacterium]|nr:hypothetical protein [Polyangiaceae bacterium]
MPTPRVDGANFDRSRVADQTDTLRAELDAALEEVATELREAQGTLAARDAAVGCVSAGVQPHRQRAASLARDGVDG